MDSHCLLNQPYLYSVAIIETKTNSGVPTQTKIRVRVRADSSRQSLRPPKSNRLLRAVGLGEGFRGLPSTKHQALAWVVSLSPCTKIALAQEAHR
jgi:hypothetical protein